VKKVLIIEDDEILRKGIIETLVESNYQVMFAPDGETGVKQALSESPDIIICDIMMPGIDGYEVKKRLEQNEVTREIPFVFLSAKVDKYDIRKGMNFGADDYITKPFLPDDLIQTIETRLKKKEYYDTKVQEIENILDEKEKFISMVAHEYRGILTVIDLSTEILTKYSDKITIEQKSRYLDQIKTSSLKMNTILNDILLLSKSSIGKVEPNPTDVDIKVFFKSIISGIDPTTERITIHYTGVEKKTVYIDDKILWHIITNIVSNSLKYSKKAVSIIVDIQPKSIKVTVKDQGIGIPNSYLNHIYKPFARAQNVGEMQGTGLGLSIVRQLIEILNGEISFESKVNIGTTFLVTIPT
jgi:signal transduction histidine kinase